MKQLAFESLLQSVRACSLCADKLSHGARPILQVHPNARILIAGQAPGAKVHKTGIPFDDPSGKRLREWMGIDREIFYDSQRVAILPMGFCYPGKGQSGDLPPVPLCAETWRENLLAHLANIQLSLVIGQYALAWHLPSQAKTLTQTVQQWAQYGPEIMPLPHPSPRNNIWLKKHPWFEEQVVPVLRQRVSAALVG